MAANIANSVSDANLGFRLATKERGTKDCDVAHGSNLRAHERKEGEMQRTVIRLVEANPA